MKRRYANLWLILATLTLAACGSSRSSIDPTTDMMDYYRNSTAGNLAVMTKKYSLFVEQHRLDNDIQPGMYADYGVMLALMGRNSEANRMFNNEVSLFPNAERYVRQLKLQLVPEYISDTTCDTTTIYIDIPLDSLIGPDGDRESVRKAREQEKLQKMTAKEQMAKQRKEEKKRKEAQKKAEQKAKEKAKKEQENAKKEAKKAAEKQKEEERIAKEKQREEAQRLKAEQREQQREEQRLLREQQREEAKRQKALEREAKNKGEEEE